MKRTKYKYSGKTSTRPDNLTTNDIGYEYFDIEKNIVSFWNGTEWIELSPESQDLYEVSVVDNSLRLLNHPIQTCKNLVDNTTILLPNTTEDYKEVKLIFNNSSNITLNLTSEETSSPMVISQIGVIEITFKKILDSWNVSQKAYNTGINIVGEQ